MCVEAHLWEVLALRSMAEGECKDGAHWLEARQRENAKMALAEKRMKKRREKGK